MPPLRQLQQNDLSADDFSFFNEFKIDVLVESVLQDSKYLFHSICDEAVEHIKGGESKFIPMSYSLTYPNEWTFISSRKKKKISLLGKYTRCYAVKENEHLKGWAAAFARSQNWGYAWELEALHSLEEQVPQRSRLGVHELKVVHMVDKLKKIKLEEIMLK